MFRVNGEYNMCIFSVVGSETWLKITQQSSYEVQNLMSVSNQTDGVVQGHWGVQHVPLLCGGKWEEAQNHTRVHMRCKTWCLYQIRLTGLFRVIGKYNMCLFPVVGSETWLKITPQSSYEVQNLISVSNQTDRDVWGSMGSTTCASSLWWEVRLGSKSHHRVDMRCKTWGAIKSYRWICSGSSEKICLCSVVGRETWLKITTQGWYEVQSLMLLSNQTDGIVQDQWGVEYVPLLCGGKWEFTNNEMFLHDAMDWDMYCIHEGCRRLPTRTLKWETTENIRFSHSFGLYGAKITEIGKEVSTLSAIFLHHGVGCET